MSTILAIDPGLTTGWAQITYSDDDPGHLLDGGEIRDKNSSVAVGAWFDRFEAQDLVVMEGWEYRKNKFSVDANLACGPIGVVRWLCYVKGIDLVIARPIDRSVVTDEMLRANGDWYSGGRGHAREATRHGIAYLLRHNHLPTMNAYFKRT